MPPLFPRPDEPLVLKQGHTGDCYLLSALDTIFNLGQEGRQLLASKFNQTADGVQVRIKRTDQSSHLKLIKMTGKYTHTYDAKTDEDVFFITNARLKEIDEATVGVQTNSLAVKILERLSSYYYVGDWSEDDNMLASIRAHNINLRHSDTSTVFVGKLIGIQANDTGNMDEILKLKIMSPKEPVYISMSYGQADIYGKYHGRHALRMDNIVTKPDGNHEIWLRNPWDNQEVEKYTLEDLKKRACRFCTYSPDLAKYELTRLLLKGPEEQGSYIFANPELMGLLCSMQKITPLMDSRQIKSSIDLHKKIPYLLNLYNAMPADSQLIMLQCMAESNGDKAQFLQSLLTRLPGMNLLKLILEQDTDHDNTGSIIVELASRYPAQVLFKDPDLYNVVVNAAIHHKTLYYSGNREKACQFVENGLKTYFISESGNQLTRSGGLRDFVIASILPKELIGAKFTPGSILANSVSYFLNSFIPDQNKIIKHIQEGASEMVNEEFLNEVLKEFKCQNPRALFVGLHKISELNTKMAKALFPFAAKKINELFKVSIEQLTQEIGRDELSNFKTWFMSIQNPPVEVQAPLKVEKVDNAEQLRVVEKEAEERVAKEKLIQKQRTEAAEKIISYYEQQIKSLQVSFSSAMTALAAAEQRFRLLDQLSQLVKDKVDLVESQKQLGYVSEHPRVFIAIEAKKQEINNASIHHVLKLREAKKAAEETALQLKQNLQKIEREAQLIKIRQEEAKAREEAEFTVTSYEKQIQSLVVSFEGIQTTSELEEHKQLLLEYLDEILNEGNLDLALEKLGTPKVYPRKIVDALEAKKLEINQAADQQIRALDKIEKEAIEAGRKKQLEELAKVDRQKFIRKNAEEVIKGYVNIIDQFSVLFNNPASLQAVASQRTALLIKLDNIIKGDMNLVKAQNNLGYSSLHPDIENALVDKKREIREGAKILEDKINAQNEVLNILNNANFTIYLNEMKKMAERLEKNETKDKNYHDAAVKGRNLYNDLNREYRKLLESDKPNYKRVDEFKKNCLGAIKDASPTLEQHRGWKQFLADFASALIQIITVTTVHMATGRWRLFTTQTEAAQTANEMAEVIIGIKAGGLRYQHCR